MDANARRDGGSAGRTLAVALIVVVLAAVVAIASGGSTPRGAIGERRPSEGLLDAAFSLFVVLMAAGAVLVAIMLSLFRRHRPDGVTLERPGPVRSLITFLVTIALLAVVVRSFAGRVGQRSQPPVPANGTPSGGGGDASPTRFEPQFTFWPVLAVCVLVAVALIGWWLAARGRRSILEPPQRRLRRPWPTSSRRRSTTCGRRGTRVAR